MQILSKDICLLIFELQLVTNTMVFALHLIVLCALAKQVNISKTHLNLNHTCCLYS